MSLSTSKAALNVISRACGRQAWLRQRARLARALRVQWIVSVDC